MRSYNLKLGFPGGVQTPNEYESASELLCGGCTKLRLQSSNAAIYLAFGEGIGGIVWQDEEFFYPVAGIINRPFDAVRVRNAVAGEIAQVVLSASI